MSDHTYSKPFYDLNEVKEHFLATKDLSFKKDIDKAIISLIHTNRLTPYVKYKGLVDIAVESQEMSKEAKKEIVDALSHTIETEMSKLEIGELISPLDYDSTTNINDIIYLVKKLLFSLNGRQATRTYGKQPYVEGIFRLEPINVMHTYAGIKINLGLGMFLSQAIQLELNELEFSEDDFDGYVLYPSHYSGNDKIELEYQCELIFSSHDLEYILTVINRSHELPDLHNSLKNANRIISQQNNEINKLEKSLRAIQPEQPKNDVKDSIYSLIFVLKELLLNPDISAYHFKNEGIRSTGQPTQNGLIQHITDMKIPKLSKRSIEDIFSKSNKSSNN